MVKHFETVVMTKDEYCCSYMGEEVKKMVAESGIRNGIVSVITAHTNCGILVTEPLPCIMSDLDVLLHKLATTTRSIPTPTSCPPMAEPLPTHMAICVRS